MSAMMMITLTTVTMVMMLVMMVPTGASSSSMPALPLTCSGCPVKHLQQHFCDSEVVIRGKVRNCRKVKVSAIYKGLESVAVRGVKLTINFEAPPCKKANLIPGSIYLMMGHYHDDVLRISACDSVEPWLSLTSVQRSGVKEAYSLFCDQCSINSTFSIIRPELQQDWSFDYNEMNFSPSHYWRTEDCFYNPLASSSYGVEDCETQHSICVPDAGGRCSWLATDKFNTCAKRRETNSCMVGIGAIAVPSWRCRQDCMTVPKGCMRNLCLDSTAGILCPSELQDILIGPQIPVQK
ncbi:metalloproteinase inhibitor 1-like [Diadema setosum]|uniref:metalloproteinase inhibitor 1-like n=1 Tax=Diadema setosum TaxID=31175 RepID=UPI003B3AC344